jgi:hypothetical protein
MERMIDTLDLDAVFSQQIKLGQSGSGKLSFMRLDGGQEET